jgi:hypothetical protein
MLIAALAQFGMSLKDLSQCRSMKCVQLFEKRSRDVLRIDWKPVSVFPEEAKRFR